MRRLALAILIASCAPEAPVNVPPLTTATPPAPDAPARAFDYPPARRGDDVDVMHGVTIADPYRWLENDSEETRAWFEAEDVRARRAIAELDAKSMVEDMTALFANPLPRTVQRRGKHSWIRKGSRLVEQPLDRVVFDESAHAEDGAVTQWPASNDGSYFLVEQSKHGADMRTGLVVDTKDGKVRERLVGLEDSHIAWAAHGFFYAFTPPEAPHADRFGYREIRYHALGTAQATDRVVVPATHDKDASSATNPIAVTKDGGRLLVQTFGNWQRSAYALVDLTKPAWPVTALPEVKDAIVSENAIWVRTKTHLASVKADGSLDPRLATTPDLMGIDPVGPFVAATYAARMGDEDLGFVRRGFFASDFRPLRTLVTPRGTSDWVRADPDSTVVTVTREGLGIPAHRLDFDPHTGALVETTPSKVAWDTNAFAIDRKTATSKDGTRIPITILRRKDTPVDGSAALAVYGYGGFANSAEQIFYPPWMVWADAEDRVFATCHTRGGVEFGEAWHDAGARHHRQKTIDDFHACIEQLHKDGYGTSARTVTQGWSHGGLLVTAAALQRPDLQRVVIAQAPLEDMIRFPIFGRGGVSEYGDPKNADDFKALLGFSPLQNVKDGVAYPAFFVTAPSADERVHPMHPRKLVAALQHASTGGEVLLKVLWDAGHHGGGKDDANATLVEGWAFALSKMPAFEPTTLRPVRVVGNGL